MKNDKHHELQHVLMNHESRLLLLEHDIGTLQNRMPKSKKRRVFWLSGYLIQLGFPILGAWAALFLDDPWKTALVLGAFGALVSKNLTQFFDTLSSGPRPHRSLFVEDHREKNE